MKEIGVVSWNIKRDFYFDVNTILNRENYPHVKCLDNIFAKFSPSENNHVYSIRISNVQPF